MKLIFVIQSEILPLVTALATNETLTELDITGHAVGDELAIMLGRTLMVFQIFNGKDDLIHLIGESYITNIVGRRKRVNSDGT